LSDNLLTPTDLGGYYHVEADDGVTFLSSAPCLAGLSPSSAQSGRAVTALLGPDLGSLPEIVEVVVSYPGSAALPVYRAVATTMQGCPAFSAGIAGADVHVPMAAAQMPLLGDASSLYQGQFTQAGRTLQLSLAMAADNGEVILVAYLDTQPPANAIFGGVVATISAAIGKEA
jgi:hypothetical protein